MRYRLSFNFNFNFTMLILGMTNYRTSKPPRQHDELLKGAFEEFFPDFLRFLYSEADVIFDFNRGIQFMDKELLSIVPDRERKKGKRIADLLAKVHLNNGTEKWILVHTEIEGGSQKDFASRMFQYHYRLFDRFRVPVETIAVFTGARSQPRPSRYYQQLIKTRLSFEYCSYHIFDHSEQELLNMSNPFALIVLACQKALGEGKVPDAELGADRLTIAKALLKHHYERDRIIRFLTFLKNFLYINDLEINSIFEQEIVNLTGGTITMGILEAVKKIEKERARHEGLQEGAMQKSYEVVRNLIQQLVLPDEQIAQLAGTSNDFVQKVRCELE